MPPEKPRNRYSTSSNSGKSITSPASMPFLKLSRKALKKSGRTVGYSCRAILRVIVYIAAVETPAVSSGAEQSSHRMFRAMKLAAVLRI